MMMFMYRVIQKEVTLKNTSSVISFCPRSFKFGGCQYGPVHFKDQSE